MKTTLPSIVYTIQFEAQQVVRKNNEIELIFYQVRHKNMHLQTSMLSKLLSVTEMENTEKWVCTCMVLKIFCFELLTEYLM